MKNIFVTTVLTLILTFSIVYAVYGSISKISGSEQKSPNSVEQPILPKIKKDTAEYAAENNQKRLSISLPTSN